MSFAFDWNPIVNMAIDLELMHQRYPDVLAFATVDERVWVTDDQQSIARARQHDVDTLGC